MGKLGSIGKKVAGGTKKVGLWWRRHGPEVQTGISVATSIGGAALTGWGTLRADKKIKEHKAKLAEIEQQRKEDPSGYSEKDYKHDKRVVKARIAKDVLISYAPAAACESVSIFTNINSTRSLRKENQALAASYIALDKSYKAYKERTKNKIGVEEERDIQDNTEVEETNPETGEITKKKVPDKEHKTNPYRRWFGIGHPSWDLHDMHANLSTALGWQNMLTNKLHANQYLEFNQALTYCGYKPTRAGHHTGWVDGMGDGFVDLGPAVNDPEMKRKILSGGFLDGFWIEFNVDGPIDYYFDDLEEAVRGAEFSENEKMDREFEARVRREP